MSAAEDTSHPDTSDTPKHQYSIQGRIRSVEITAEEILGGLQGGRSLPAHVPRTSMNLKKRYLLQHNIYSTSPGNLVLSNVPHPVVCREWRKQITIKGRVSTSQLSVEPESLYLHYLLYIYTVSTQYLHTVGTLQFQNIAIGHTATLLPRPLPNINQWTMKGRHRGQKLKYSKYDLLNVEMIECPRAAKTSPGTILFLWFIPEAVNMYSYSCLLINCHNVIIISIFYIYYQKYPTKGVNLSSSHVQLFGFHDLWIISSDGCPIPLSTRVYKISSGSLWISKLFEFVVDWSII